MFTGIIEAVGQVADIQMREGDMQLYLRTGQLDLADVKLGDSIAVNGVCLTAVQLPGDGFVADVSRETLAHTRFDLLKVGEKVNLEKALMPTSRLGGHLVSGHVDGVGEVVERHDDARSIRFTLRAPASLQRYIAAKGSITVDGVSLTVNTVDNDCFGLNIVPHTAKETIIDGYTAGRKVHLEVDLIARYLERLLSASHQDHEPSDTGLTMEKLAEQGYLSRR
ncbi:MULTISPECIES: riboflavin synthase [Nitrincola]|uniref:Riboflavin synthase n=1 Tax=Nitrincola nitratireducens TaxID=1229521 RepID=W9UT22_9GAMM|nr:MULTISPECIES: riboflavin synthase [Nitrincola]EXJ10363.1 Riboflavin synthase alpha chain [Nitrincola nitratireducens]